MQPGINSTERILRPNKYLEVYIEENGAIIFSNLAAGEEKLVEEISGEKRKGEEFYCG